MKDRSRQIASRLLRLNRSIAARTGQSKPLALRLTGEAGELLATSIREARRLAERLRKRARGRGARAKLAARHAPHSRKTNRRLAKFRVGAEGRISHLKRRYGLNRSRLKGHPGARTWAA